MIKYITLLTRFTIIPCLFLFVLGCSSEKEEKVAKLYDLDSFIKSYNVEIDKYVDANIAEIKKAGVKLQEDLAPLVAADVTLSEAQQVDLRKIRRAIESNKRDLKKFEFRKSMGGYFTFKSPDEIPTDLVWQKGMDEPEIGDSRAKKGGTFNYFVNDFPKTLRVSGPLTNGYFRSYVYDDIDIYLIGIHPDTNKPIPGLANEWALSKDERTVYYRIDPEATYSDGEKIKAKDFMANIYVRASNNVFHPYYKQYFKTHFANITVFDDRTLAITLPEKKPDMYLSTATIQPASPKFYSEYGPDYKERYQWRVPPTTGAYTVLKKDIKMGRSITLSRVKDWWAKDRKYYRNRFNVDKIRYLVIRDLSKSFELFKVGKIDAFWIHSPSYWYDKTAIDAVFDGYIEKKKFVRTWPIIPWGIYLNVDEGILKNRDLRTGLHHAMNFDRVNNQVFRGDYVRINQFSDGFGRFTDNSIKVRKYNPKLAREYFAKAGFTEEGRDRILRTKDGVKLSFSCTIRQDPGRKQILTILKEAALDCGVELKLDIAEMSVAFAKTSQKRHESTYSAWNVRPPTPKYRQFFHSESAFDDTGARNKSSNNMNVFADEQMDIYADQVRNARTYEELEGAAHKAQKIIHDEAIFIPGLGRNYTALGHWRWMKWPDTETTKFSYTTIYEPLETHLFWIDEDVKKETLKARRAGKTFPEVELLIDSTSKN